MDVGSIREGARVLLINPPVADTLEAEEQDMLDAVQPIGLLRLATYFRQRDCEVQLLDCLRHSQVGDSPRRHVRKTLDCGNVEEEGLRKELYHFGLDEAELREALATYDEPDFIGIGTVFTWHLEPCRDVIRVCRELFPGATIGVGGNAPMLCPDEAAALGADFLGQGAVGGEEFLSTAIDLVDDHEYDYLQLIRGCPHSCSYCVTKFLNGGRVLARDPEEICLEMERKVGTYGVQRFLFFDDFIMYRQKRYLDRFLDLAASARLGVELDFALGLSAHLVTEPFVARLRNAGVRRIMLALETLSEIKARAMKRPQSVTDFVRAVEILEDHGFRREQLKVFVLMGMPEQTMEEILRAILFLFHMGVAPNLTTYTLTPQSGDMARYGDRVRGRTLEELAPCLWRFAHSGMRARDLDAVYRYFHGRFFPLERLADSETDDPVIREMQRLIRTRDYLPPGM